MPSDNAFQKTLNNPAEYNKSETAFVHCKWQKGYHQPIEKCVQNCMLFMIKGVLLMNSREYPGVTLREGDVILQSIGSALELLALEDSDYLVYWFNELHVADEMRGKEVFRIAEPPVTYAPLKTKPILRVFIESLCKYISYGSLSEHFISLKAQELSYLVMTQYPVEQLRVFFYPISKYTESFHYFVIQNYDKVKNVDEFAHLGGYSTTTFRRMFKSLYGKPVYEWMLDKKREGILFDLKHSNDRITVISQRYGFDALPHFANFCKTSFGLSPRALRLHLRNKNKL